MVYSHHLEVQTAVGGQDMAESLELNMVLLVPALSLDGAVCRWGSPPHHAQYAHSISMLLSRPLQSFQL